MIPKFSQDALSTQKTTIFWECIICTQARVGDRRATCASGELYLYIYNIYLQANMCDVIKFTQIAWRRLGRARRRPHATDRPTFLSLGWILTCERRRSSRRPPQPRWLAALKAVVGARSSIRRHTRCSLPLRPRGWIRRRDAAALLDLPSESGTYIHERAPQNISRSPLNRGEFVLRPSGHVTPKTCAESSHRKHRRVDQFLMRPQLCAGNFEPWNAVEFISWHRKSSLALGWLCSRCL